MQAFDWEHVVDTWRCLAIIETAVGAVSPFPVFPGRTDSAEMQYAHYLDYFHHRAVVDPVLEAGPGAVSGSFRSCSRFILDSEACPSSAM